ncbi:hypothetical protein Aph02nite_05170 [Actinoplanes philippinensis]|uniref:Uncharacterized protein n=1 Tax=Actinoplanes philippinensis TaxID=35752 RepID=A0A1I2D0C0_9ACTN|nr:hypothetical protein [Actinoplanes philippinensis]GIE74567.1 hypothetical protein Aph02nite_05170 [Actinoplanes philippinensis]SFE73942.1 hypothetical protein SAMN05421541_103317 [Actinoplanes philippinensis]
MTDTRCRAPLGAGSRLEGRLGWLPSVRAFVLVMALLWLVPLGMAARAHVLGLPVAPHLAGIPAVAVLLSLMAGLIAVADRMARPEADHLRTWVAGRLETTEPKPAQPR